MMAVNLSLSVIMALTPITMAVRSLRWHSGTGKQWQPGVRAGDLKWKIIVDSMWIQSQFQYSESVISKTGAMGIC
jgi:hypothetical protein